MATVAKSLPRSLKNTHKWLIYNIFLFIYRIFSKKHDKRIGKNGDTIISLSHFILSLESDWATIFLIFCQLGICLSSLRIGASYSRNSKKRKIQAYAAQPYICLMLISVICDMNASMKCGIDIPLAATLSIAAPYRAILSGI